jgi:hypothetical protein
MRTVPGIIPAKYSEALQKFENAIGKGNECPIE